MLGESVESDITRQLMERKLLTLNETAHVLGMGKTKTYALIQNGELESMHIGTSLRVPASAIERYIAARLAAEFDKRGR